MPTNASFSLNDRCFFSFVDVNRVYLFFTPCFLSYHSGIQLQLRSIERDIADAKLQPRPIHLRFQHSKQLLIQNKQQLSELRVVATVGSEQLPNLLSQQEAVRVSFLEGRQNRLLHASCLQIELRDRSEWTHHFRIEEIIQERDRNGWIWICLRVTQDPQERRDPFPRVVLLSKKHTHQTTIRFAANRSTESAEMRIAYTGF